MRIERVTDLQEILRCLPMEREIRKKGRDKTRESDMLLFVQSQLQNPLFGFWILYDEENNIKGYTIGVLSLIPGFQRLHVLRMYAKEKEAFNLLEGTLKDWIKAHKVKIAVMTTSSHIKAFQRKYGYKVVSVNMERRYF